MVLFHQGFCCSESVLQAVAEGRGIQSELIPKIATGLCAGISRTGGICGAVSGGVWAISRNTGRSAVTESRGENDRIVRQFLSRCEEVFGSTNCEKLIGCRLDTAEGQQFFKEHPLHARCAGFTRDAARLASELLAQAGHVQGPS